MKEDLNEAVVASWKYHLGIWLQEFRKSTEFHSTDKIDSGA
jgi:hypothetical protein